MTDFAILLGGDLVVTARLRRQIEGHRVIAADSGMMHAAALGVTPELWVGDFDSAGSELALQYRGIPHQIFPAEKDATDGSIAVAEAVARGATRIILAGGLGGQADHMVGILGTALQLARRGLRCFVTSGSAEAWPVLSGGTRIDLPQRSRISLIPFADFSGLDLDGVKWPLSNCDVPLGSTLTMSNIAHGEVRITLKSGYGIAIAYPAYDDA